VGGRRESRCSQARGAAASAQDNWLTTLRCLIFLVRRDLINAGRRTTHPALSGNYNGKGTNSSGERSKTERVRKGILWVTVGQEDSRTQLLYGHANKIRRPRREYGSRPTSRRGWATKMARGPWGSDEGVRRGDAAVPLGHVTIRRSGRGREGGRDNVSGQEGAMGRTRRG